MGEGGRGEMRGHEKGREMGMGLVCKMEKIRKLEKIIYRAFDLSLYAVVII